MSQPKTGAVEPPALVVNQSSSIESAAHGGVIAVCEFRGQKIDPIEWTDKNTGQKRSAVLLALSLEQVGPQGEVVQIQAAYDSPRGEDVKPLPFVRGDLVIVQFHNYVESREGNKGRTRSVTLFKARA